MSILCARGTSRGCERADRPREASTSTIDVIFGSQGNSAPYLVSGWSIAEESFTWTCGNESHVLLPAPTIGGAWTLVVDVFPFVSVEERAQRLDIQVNDVPVGSSTVDAPGTLRFHVPESAIRANQAIHVRFLHPDAGRPVDRRINADARFLAFAFRSLKLARADDPASPDIASPAQAAASRPHGERNDAGATRGAGPSPSLTKLMLEFHSLGYSCEFGLVQRRFGAEPLDLFRFASVPIPSLVKGIDEGLIGLGEAGQTSPYTLVHSDGRREIAVREDRYGFVYHTSDIEGRSAPADLLRQEQVRLRLKKRKFLEDVLVADRIFVRALAPGTETLDDAMALYEALVRRGANTLLCITLADASHPPGTVEPLMPGLLVGRIEHFSVLASHTDIAFDDWVSVCRKARAMMPGRAA